MVSQHAVATAYDDALYRVDIGGHRYTLNTSSSLTHVEHVLADAACRSLTIITVDNPGSQKCDRTTFTRHHSALTQQLRELGIRFFASAALAPDCDWPVEHGVAIANIPLASAYHINRRFDQHACVRITQEQGVTLHWTVS